VAADESGSDNVHREARASCVTQKATDTFSLSSQASHILKLSELLIITVSVNARRRNLMLQLSTNGLLGTIALCIHPVTCLHQQAAFQMNACLAGDICWENEYAC